MYAINRTCWYVYMDGLMAEWTARLYMELVHYHEEGVAMIYDLVEVADVMMVNRSCLFCKCQLVTSFVIYSLNRFLH